MTTAKHTPGPWRITRERDGKSGWKGLSVESPSGFVANLVFQLDDSGLANARLIAAAPKLLEALKEVQWSDAGCCPQCARIPEVGHQPACIVGAAIAEAEGRQR